MFQKTTGIIVISHRDSSVMEDKNISIHSTEIPCCMFPWHYIFYKEMNKYYLKFPEFKPSPALSPIYIFTEAKKITGRNS